MIFLECKSAYRYYNTNLEKNQVESIDDPFEKENSFYLYNLNI